MMKLHLPLKHNLYIDEKLFELHENDFVKYFSKCRNLFKYFVSQITVIPQNDIFLYYWTNQISIKLLTQYFYYFVYGSI